MKPAMQRDLLAAFWLLFDEFEIGNDDCPGGDERLHTPAASPLSDSPPPRESAARPEIVVSGSQVVRRTSRHRQ
jgi:hypothetical protein